jgi:hypothetical protein
MVGRAASLNSKSAINPYDQKEYISVIKCSRVSQELIDDSISSFGRYISLYRGGTD